MALLNTSSALLPARFVCPTRDEPVYASAVPSDNGAALAPTPAPRARRALRVRRVAVRRAPCRGAGGVIEPF